MNEYNPYDNNRFGKGEGDEYLQFIVNTLKPFIDKNYRTLKNKANTLIAGSSMGGLIAMYAIAKYPQIFGGAGVFSPAFWVSPAIVDFIKHQRKKMKGRIYFYAGAMESKEMVPDIKRVFHILKNERRLKIKLVVSEAGKHNEPTWRKEFSAFFEFIQKGLPKTSTALF